MSPIRLQACLLVGLAVMACTRPATPPQPAVVATVGEGVVLASELREELERVRRESGEAPDPGAFEALRAGVLESLIERRSNVATLPADRPSAWVEDRFASIPIDVPLPEASVFAQGRVTTGAAPGRMHARAWSLSGGESMTGQGAGSSSSWQLGFGGRGWSASLVRK